VLGLCLGFTRLKGIGLGLGLVPYDLSWSGFDLEPNGLKKALHFFACTLIYIQNPVIM